MRACSKKRAGRSREESGVRILFMEMKRSPADGLKPGPPLNSCEITVRPCGRTLKLRGTRCGHITSLPKEDGHVQTVR